MKSTQYLFALNFVLILVLSACAPLARYQRFEKPYDVHQKAWDVATLVNEYRVRNGLLPLEWDPNLYRIALQQTEDMRDRNFISHVNPDGETPFDRLKNFYIFYYRSAENLAVGQTSPEVVLSNWIRSPAHKRNLLSSLYVYHAVAYDSLKNNWTHLFIDYGHAVFFNNHYGNGYHYFFQ